MHPAPAGARLLKRLLCTCAKRLARVTACLWNQARQRVRKQGIRDGDMCGQRLVLSVTLSFFGESACKLCGKGKGGRLL